MLKIIFCDRYKKICERGCDFWRLDGDCLYAVNVYFDDEENRDKFVYEYLKEVR